MQNIDFENLKAELWAAGKEAIQDFIRFPVDPDWNKENVDRIIRTVYEEMPQKRKAYFYEKYGIHSIEMEKTKKILTKLEADIMELHLPEEQEELLFYDIKKLKEELRPDWLKETKTDWKKEQRGMEDVEFER